MIRIALENDLPVCCSVCRQAPAAHDPKLRYIDFDASYDGPVVDDPATPSELGVYIEKIVICEKCVAAAARLIGLVEDGGEGSKVEAWKCYSESLEEDMVAKDRAISNLSHTVGTLLDHPANRPMGRPQFAGPDTHEDQVKKMRSAEAKKSRAKKKATSEA